jgi:hypothetical protein
MIKEILTLTETPTRNKMGQERIELSSRNYEFHVLPLNYKP